MDFLVRKSVLLILSILWLISWPIPMAAAEKGPAPRTTLDRTTPDRAVLNPKKNAELVPDPLVATTPLWKLKAPQVEQIRLVIELLTKEADGIAADVTPESGDGQRRAALRKRIEFHTTGSRKSNP
ncbi:MAG: hypothetical protein HQL65_18285 [Magnetococcales bacterium]|nr:hypothetical protein [Magnetococcales bacterium]